MHINRLILNLLLVFIACNLEAQTNYLKGTIVNNNNDSIQGFIDFRIPCMVGDFTPETVLKGKLKKGDVIVAINDSAGSARQEVLQESAAVSSRNGPPTR